MQVPPMPAEKARRVVEEELRGTPLEEVFEWIDLDTPLGSASISQVLLQHPQQHCTLVSDVRHHGLVALYACPVMSSSRYTAK